MYTNILVTRESTETERHETIAAALVAESVAEAQETLLLVLFP